MGSLHPQIGTFKWSRCSNKRVLYALCTFVDIIVNSLICVRAERTGEMFLCLVMEPGWAHAAGVMLCAHLVLSLSHSNVTSRSGFRDQHKVYQEKWLLEIENDIFYPAYYRVLKILSLRYSFSSLPFARIIISRIRPALYLLAVLSERRKGHPDGSEAMGMGRIVSGID